MTSTNDPSQRTTSAKQAAMAVIEKQPRDASLDEISDALWTWSTGTPQVAAAWGAAASRLLTLNPAELVMASRASRDAVILGLSRQIALDVVHGLPEQAPLEDLLVAVATWHWSDELTD